MGEALSTLRRALGSQEPSSALKRVPGKATDPASAKSLAVALGCFDAEPSECVPVKGGVTNTLYRVGDGRTSVLVRVFGAEGLIDRDLETETFAALAEHLGRHHVVREVRGAHGGGGRDQ